MTEKLKENSFDLIIEKAGLDSIATKDTEDVPLLLKTIFNGIFNILKPGGFILSISIKNPQFWEQNIHNYLIKNKMFRIVERIVTVFTIEKNPTLMNMYCYKLKSLKE